MDINPIVDKAYESSSLEELLDAPASALQGLSETDAERLREAFNIRTVRDLATNKFFLRAQGIHALAQSVKK